MVLGFTRPSILKRAGIVGMNRRNVDYIARYNPRHLYPQVDDKLKTKRLMQQAGIAVPKLLGVIKYQQQTRALDTFLRAHPHFAIKPAKGSGGKGILVCNDCADGHYHKPSGEEITLENIQRHASNILSGLYSLGGKPDIVLIEEMINFTDDFNGFSYEGVPDIRIICFQGYPVMAMTRLSTHASDGKANLHQGAVGVGIDLASGKALCAVQYAKPLSQHPDTGKAFTSLHIPFWQDCLTIAARCFDVTNLGYLGADIVIDKEHGPLLLELNARPGLSIQLANGTGLLPRLQYIEWQAAQGPLPASTRVDIAMRQFGAAAS